MKKLGKMTLSIRKAYIITKKNLARKVCQRLSQNKHFSTCQKLSEKLLKSILRLIKLEYNIEKKVSY